MYRAHARALLPLAFLIAAGSALFQALLTGVLGWVGALLAAVIGIIATFLLQAALVKAVQDLMDGRRDLSLGETVKAVGPFTARVAGASILAGIAIGVGLILLIAPGLFLLTIWCLIVPVIVLEGASIGGAFTRSRELVRGYGWQVFGTWVLVFLVLLAASIVLGLLLSPLPDAAQSLISSVATGTLITPYVAVVLTLGYFRLERTRRTGGQPPTAPPQPAT